MFVSRWCSVQKTVLCLIMLFDHYLFFCSLCALQFFALFEWSNFLDSLLLLASALDDKNLLKKIGMWEPFDSFQPLGLKGLQQLQTLSSLQSVAAAEQKIQIKKSRFFNPTQAGNPSFYQHWWDSLGIINGYVKFHQLSRAKIPLWLRKVPSTGFFSYAKYHQRFKYHAKYLQWPC